MSSDLLVFGDRVGLDGYLMDLYFVQRSVVAIHRLSLHQVQSLESVDYLCYASLTLPKAVYCLFSLEMRL